MRRSPRPAVSLVLLAVAVTSCATALNDLGVDGSSVGTFDAGFDASLDVARQPGAETGVMPVHEAGLPDVNVVKPVPDATATKEAAALPEASSPSDVATLPEASSVDVGVMTTPDAGIDAGVDAGLGSIPTSCAKANHNVGCCGPDGKNYYCLTATSTTLKSTTCTSGKVCTWDATEGYYKCLTGTVGVAGPPGDPLACE